MNQFLREHEIPRTVTGKPDGRSARKVETRRRVMEAACELFATRGYTETSLELIAETAGVSKGTIFYNYRNKADLYEQLLVGCAELVGEQMREAIDGLRGWEALDRLIWQVLRHVDEQPSPSQLLVTELFRPHTEWRPTLEKARSLVIGPTVGVLVEVAEDREARGAVLHGIQDEELPNIAVSLLGALVVATLDRRTFSPSRSLEDVHRALMLTMAGLQ